MSKHLQHDLEKLQQNILVQSAAVEEMIRRAICALHERNVKMAQQVIAGEAQIDEEENEIEDECLKMLALHQPVATDLRRIAAVLKINNDLERMADLAVDIAKQAVQLADLPFLVVPEKLQRMTDLTIDMVGQSLRVFIEQDVQQARRVCRLDRQIDCYDTEITQVLIAAMHRSPELIESALCLLRAVRYLERIADHAANIAEDAVYLVEGEIIRHHPEAIKEMDALQPK
jgi:phosphate transport system protein